MSLTYQHTGLTPPHTWGMENDTEKKTLAYFLTEIFTKTFSRK